MDSFIAKRKSYTAKPNSEIWEMFSAVLSFSLYCLMKAIILSSEHVMFSASPFKYSFILKRETEQKLLSHSYRSACWLMAKRITNGSGPWDITMLLLTIGWLLA